LPAQRRQQSGEDQGGLAAARAADDGDEGLARDLRDEIGDDFVAAAKEGGVFCGNSDDPPGRRPLRGAVSIVLIFSIN